MKVQMKSIDPKTKGFELDGLLTTLFGRGKFVWLFVDRERKKFYATDEEPIYTPPGLTLFSAGQVGLPPQAEGTGNGRPAECGRNGDQSRKTDSQGLSQLQASP